MEKLKYTFKDNGEIILQETGEYIGFIRGDGYLIRRFNKYDLKEVERIRGELSLWMKEVERIKDELLLQMTEEIPPEKWRTAWVRCIGEQALPRELIRRYEDRWNGWEPAPDEL